MEKTSCTIRVGSGDFNDIVVKNNDVLPEHLHIIVDEEGCQLYRVHPEAKVYINGKEMENRYADITEDDELRIGGEDVNYKEILSDIKKMIEVVKEERELEKMEKKVENDYLVRLLIYFGLAFFFVWSLIEGKKMWIIISAILFSSYLIGGIILTLVTKKYETEAERKSRIRIRVITFIIMLPFLIHASGNMSKYDRMDRESNERMARFEQASSNADYTGYYRVVYNYCGHDVTISYRKKRGSIDTTMTYQIAQGAYDTIAMSSDFGLSMSTLNQARSTGEVKTLDFAYDGVTITCDDGSSIIHKTVGRNGNNVEPEEHNILSISSWEKDEDHKIAKYTLTPEDILCRNTSLKSVTVKK